MAAAEMPRALDVREFTQARDTELRYLFQTVREETGDGRFGAGFLPRHLRRRATSHRRFVVRRRPNLRLAALYGTTPLTEAAAAGGSSAGARPSRRRRVDGGGSTLDDGDDDDDDEGVLPGRLGPGPSPSSSPAAARPTNRAMRRRPARLQAAIEASCAADLASLPQPQPQQRPLLPPASLLQPSGLWVRGEPATAPGLAATGAGGVRSPEAPGVQAVAAAGSAAGAEAEAEAATEAGLTPAAPLRRLETHVWHARRMVMEQRWGHVLAAHAVGRGRGSRALLARVRPGALHGGPPREGSSYPCVIHDASYVGCIELWGHQRALAELLRRISDPALLDRHLDRPEVISGAAEWPLSLHRPGAFPGAQLAPARALFLTDPQVTTDPEVATDPFSSLDAVAAADAFNGIDGHGTAATTAPGGGSAAAGAAAAAAATGAAAAVGAAAAAAGAAGAGEGFIDADGWATRCRLWLWVHAAAFADVWGALREVLEAADNGVPGVSGAEAEAGGGGGLGGKGGGGGQGCRAGLPGVRMLSRCPHLRRIEVVGAAAEEALARVLTPLTPPPPTLPPTSRGAGSASAAGLGANAAADGGGDVADGPGGGGGGGGDGGGGDAALGGSIWRSVNASAAGGSCDGGGGGGGRWRWRWRWPAGAVVGMVAADPRLASPVRVGAVAVDAMAAAEALGICRAGGGGGGDDSGGKAQQQPLSYGRPPRLLCDAELRRELRWWPEGGDWTAGAAALWCDPTTTTCQSRSWAPSSAGTTAAGTAATAAATAAGSSTPLLPPAPPPPPPPLTEGGVATARRAARQRLLQAGLAGCGDGGDGWDGWGVAAPAAGGAAEPTAAGAEAASAVSFPVLLIRRAGPSGAATTAAATAAAAGGGRGRRRGGGGGGGVGAAGVGGWSVVLPAHWVMPVWTALAFTGARAVGQSEWRQLATHHWTPCFPYDHPYTPAGERYVAARREELRSAAGSRPAGHAPQDPDLGAVADWSRLMSAPLDWTSSQLTLVDFHGKPSSRRKRQQAASMQHQQQQQPPNSTTAAAASAGVTSNDAGGGSAPAGSQPSATSVKAAPTAAGRPPTTSASAPATALEPTAATGPSTSNPAHPSSPVGATDCAVALDEAVLRTFLASGGLWRQQEGRLLGYDECAEGAGARGLRPQPSTGGRPSGGVGGCGGAGSGGRRVSDKSRLQGWTLRKALRLGLIRAPTATLGPPPRPPPAPSPPPQAGRGPEATSWAPRPPSWRGQDPRLQLGGVEGAGRSGERGGGRCLVYVALRVEGRGVCEAGAEVIGMYDGGASPPLVGGGGGVSGPAAAASAEGARGAEGRQALVVGYVTSAAARGSHAYPGGLALCDVGGLARLHKQQQQERHRQQRQRQQPPPVLPPPQQQPHGQQEPGQSVGDGSPEMCHQYDGAGQRSSGPALLPPWQEQGGHWREDVMACWMGVGVGGRRWGGGAGAGRSAVRLWVRNPGSSALRACRAWVLLPACSESGGRGVVGVAAGSGIQLAWG